MKIKSGSWGLASESDPNDGSHQGIATNESRRANRQNDLPIRVPALRGQGGEEGQNSSGAGRGYRVEDITNPLTRQVRYLDKLVDELAKGRKMEKILRTTS